MEVNEWYYNPYWEDNKLIFFKLSEIEVINNAGIYAIYYTNFCLFPTNGNIKECQIYNADFKIKTFTEEEFGISYSSIVMKVSTTEVLNYLLDNELPELEVWG